jgi:hypothetical protein
MTLPERARALAANLELLDARIVFSDVPAATLAILAALEATRREALEEAVQYVHELWEYGNAAAAFSELLRREFLDRPDSEKSATHADDGPRAA